MGTYALTRSASSAAFLSRSSSALSASRSCWAFLCLSLSFSAASGFSPRDIRNLCCISTHQ